MVEAIVNTGTTCYYFNREAYGPYGSYGHTVPMFTCHYLHVNVYMRNTVNRVQLSTVINMNMRQLL